MAEEIDIESAELWTETTLRSYLAERERKDCDIPELRPRMLQASGLTGEGMRYLLNAIGNKGERFDNAAAVVRRELGRRLGLAANFGIGSDLEPFYRAFARWSPCSEVDFRAIIDDEFGGKAAMSLEALIRYGVWMGALFQNQELKFEVNPLVGSVFNPHSI